MKNLSKFLKQFALSWRDFLWSFALSSMTYLITIIYNKAILEIPLAIPIILGIAIYPYFGIFIKKAYREWCEAQKIWEELTKYSQALFFQIANSTFDNNQHASKELLKIQRRIIYRHLAFLVSLKEMAKQNNCKDFKGYIGTNEFDSVKRAHNIPLKILELQSKELKILNEKGYINEPAYLSLHNLGIKFIHCIGNCEFIANKDYRATKYTWVKVCIWLLILSATLSAVPYVGPWSIVFGTSFGYSLFLLQNLQKYYLTPFNDIKSRIEIDKTIDEIEYASLSLIVGEEVNNLLGKI